MGGFVVYFLAPIPIREFGELSLVSCSEIVSRVSSISRLDLGWTFHESVQVKSTQGPRVKRRVSSASDGGAESVGIYGYVHLCCRGWWVGRKDSVARAALREYIHESQ